MNELERLGKVIETEVLIIGGGIAGLWAAVRAKVFVDDVIVVDKGPVGYTSQAYFALGGHQDLFPEEDVDDWVKDFVYFADGLVEQDIIEAIYKQSFDRIQDYQRLGVDFKKEKTADGTHRGPTRGLDHIKSLRPHPYGSGGEKMIQGLVKEAKGLGVRFLNRIFITTLLKHDNAIAGAVGFDTRSGEFYIFKTRSLVIATGECHFGGHYQAQAFVTGDGMAMGFSAGAELRNLEFPTLWIVPARYGWEGFALAFPLGARLLNARGKSFIEKYSPVLKSKMDYNFLARAMAIEAREGRGPFYMDFSTIKPRDRDFLMSHTGWMQLHIEKLKEAGIRPDVEKQEAMPGFWQAHGIKTDITMRTAVPGLFAAGRVRVVDPGVIMGGWSLCSATAFGYWAGESAGRHAKSQKPLQIDAGEVAALKKEIYTPLGSIGREPHQVLSEIQEALFRVDVLILKHEIGLKSALDRIETIRDVLVPQMGARDVHYLVRLREVHNMALIAELMLRASLMRTESRGSHYREDYPRRDDSNWLNWIVISKKNGELTFVKEPVPFDRYKFKPTRYYMDNFKIPG
jgi:succinate dehydrogenase/fumarate reductase flavoprotein subunit